MNKQNAYKNGNIKCFFLLTAACLIISAFAGCGSASDTDSSLLSASTAYPEIDTYIEKVISDEEIPGLSIVIVQGDEVIYCKGFGVTSLDNPTPVTTKTIFDLASLTKSFTATGILLLEDTGLIDIDNPIRQYLPDFQLADPRGAEITVRQLLNQTSGIPGALSEPLIFQEGENPYQKLISSLNNILLSSDPGMAFQYADLNYCLLGALIEEMSGMSYEEYMQENVFTPLGLDYTTLYPDVAEKLGKADGHQPMYGAIVVRNISLFRSAMPAGWVMSCAEDMGQWIIVQLNNGATSEGRIFPEDDIEELQNPAILYEDNDTTAYYGMGWSISNDISEEKTLWHCGDTPNFTTDMLLLPEHDTGIVVLVNSQASNLGHRIAPEVANILLGLDLKSINVPWWAHWKALDTLAITVFIFIVILLLGWLAYIGWLWRRLCTGKRCFFWSQVAGKKYPAWQITFYLIPLALLIMIMTAGYIVIKALYGYNLFEVLILFRTGAPPGLYLSGILSIFIVFLWSFILAVVGLITRHVKTGI